MKLVIALVVAVLGVLFAVYAGIDDAPGGVLLGGLIVLGAVAFGGRALLSRRRGVQHRP